MGTHEMARNKKLKADLVIVGGGGAGLAAAVSAVENGIKDVFLIEKKMLGGNTAMAVGPFAVESPAQMRAAIDTSRDEIFKKAMDYAHWKSNPKIVRAFIDKSGDTIRWLESKGLYFECLPLYYGQSPLVWHVPDGRTGFGRAVTIIKTLAEECEKIGVNVLTHTSAKKILTKANGRITGILAENEGQEYTIIAKTIIIASGGYGGNRQLLKRYYPFYKQGLVYGGVPHNTGDGLLMAIEVGANTEGLGVVIGGVGMPKRINPIRLGSPPDEIEVSLVAIIREPYMVSVNEKGERFTDESTSAHHKGEDESIRSAYALFDHSILKHMIKFGLKTGEGKYRIRQRVGLPGLEKELNALADKGIIKIADSWDRIAEYIGVDPTNLETTINKYNSDCDQGHDTFLVKDPRYLMPLRTPPFYAIGGGRFFLDTIGGIKINEHMEILDNEDNPILGIYAAGVVAGGWQAVSYCGNTTSGAAVGFAINSGRIAGENAAKFLMESE